MIKLEELLCGVPWTSIPLDHQNNLQNILLPMMNNFRAAYGMPIIISSGYRTEAHHLEIYAKKGIVPPNVPMRSNHLKGLACDMVDPNGLIKKFVNENPKYMDFLNVFFESFDKTPNWVHVQTVAFGSYQAGGTRFFNP